MPVNFPLIDPAAILPIDGVSLAKAQARIRQDGRDDVLLITLDAETKVAGVFTQNQFAAAPVQLCKNHLASGTAPRAMIVNTGYANVGTGEAGLSAALQVCRAIAAHLQVATESVLPFSTGVILEPLPAQKIILSLPTLSTCSWLEAAGTIMTTDTKAKAASCSVDIGGRLITFTGIAKGSGMIHPNMATMLAYIATDAKLPQALMERLLREACSYSFNCISVDGETSTNDSFMLIATGKVAVESIENPQHPLFVQHYGLLHGALLQVAQSLAQMIVRDGEGATKFINIVINGAHDDKDAAKVARAIAHSPLVKTAFFASDPNLGRILSAVGHAGVTLDVAKIRVDLNNVRVIEHGGRAAHYQESDGSAAMRESEITMNVDLGLAHGHAQLWTCDLSHDYVSINASYRS